MVAIDKQIASREWIGVPHGVSGFIRDFCHRINSEQEPRYIDVKPRAAGSVGECFESVTEKVAQDGGEIVFGWLVWEWPGVAVEAEHYAVWSDGQSYLDVAPHRVSRSKVLFLPDPAKTFDPNAGDRQVKQRVSFDGFPAAGEWVRLSAELDAYVHENTEGTKVKADRATFSRLSQNAREAQMRVIVELARARGRNDPCICQSGKKFKKCCGPLIQF